MSFKMFAKTREHLFTIFVFEGRKGNMNYTVRQDIKMKQLEIKINLPNVSKQNVKYTEINTEFHIKSIYHKTWFPLIIFKLSKTIVSM